MKKPTHFAIPMALILTGGPVVAAPTYQEDVQLLKKHTEIIELASGSARVAIAPAWQGRVMTSTATGPDGGGFGWINPEVIAAGIKPEAEREGLAKHIHVFGGEERLWFGPEGGPFALFFPPKVEQTFANWKTPAVLDTEAFETATPPTPTSATFIKSTQLPNRAGTVFSMDLKRTVSLATPTELSGLCGPIPDGVQAVAYITKNSVTNSGKNEWTRETGAPSIWLLGMFKPSPETTIVIPFKPGEVAELGPIAKTGYFGEIPKSRIKFGKSALFFKGDGTERGKLGIPPKRSMGIAGSWQADSGTLTLVRIRPGAADAPAIILPATATEPQVRIRPGQDDPSASWPYVDSQWKEDVDPFDGDLLNAYNDGPPEPGAKPLGPFYELETSSPALFLKPGESHTHAQCTVHLTGPREALDAIAQRTLGVSLDGIEGAW